VPFTFDRGGDVQQTERFEPEVVSGKVVDIGRDKQYVFFHVKANRNTSNLRCQKAPLVLRCAEKRLDASSALLYNSLQMSAAEDKNDAIRILVIDDEPVIRELLFDILIRKGYQVDTAEDGMQALEKAKSEKYDIVFTDIRMPGMNGVEVYRRLKVISPESRVIVMTGYGLEQMIQEALDLGAFADVRKPFDLKLIYDLVEEAVESMK
jgi:two-component system response regulator (stage 0 sporulation protein F)